MCNALDLHAVIALLEDMPTRHFETGQPILLRRGQIGTVVMAYDGTAYEVEFADRDGHAYAILSVSTDKLILLHDAPEYIAA